MSDDEKCAICLESFEDGENVEISKQKYTLPCNEKHCFHVDCIMTTFRMGSKACPLCRDIPSNFVDNEENELEMMESLARLEWKKHNEVRNRCARKDKKVFEMRKKYWEARDKAKSLSKKYEKEFSKTIKQTIKNVNKEFAPKRKELRKAIETMYKKENKFDKLVDQRKKKK